MNSTLALLKKNFTLHSNYLRYAIRLTLSCSLIVILYESLHLKNGYWAAFSVIACVWPTLGNSIQRAKHRILGTFIGMWVGILVAHSFGANRVAIDILLPIFIFLTFYLKPYHYSLYVTFTTVVTVLFICLIVPGDWQVAITRLGMTALGTLMAFLATLFVFPSHASKELPGMFSTARQSISQYYLVLCQYYLNPNSNVFQAMQSKIFQDLQRVFTILKESQQEYGYLSKQHPKQAAFYYALDAVYQHLMILEVHLPHSIETVSLQPIAQQLVILLTEIGALLKHFKTESVEGLKQKLVLLLNSVQQQRAVASRDMTIQTATYFEHIQLTIFIETLIKLVDGVSDMHTNSMR